MYIRNVTLCLRDTDATGVLYFTEQLRMAQQTIEIFLKEHGFELKNLFSHKFFIPIVHADADYFLPLYVGDDLQVRMSLLEKGTTSFQMEYSFYKGDALAGKVRIVHVVVNAQSRKKMLIPEPLLGYLDKIGLAG